MSQYKQALFWGTDVYGWKGSSYVLWMYAAQRLEQSTSVDYIREVATVLFASCLGSSAIMRIVQVITASCWG